MRKIPKAILIVIGVVIAALFAVIMASIEEGDFVRVLELLPLLAGCSIGFHLIRKRETTFELRELLERAYQRAVIAGIEYADEEYIVDECMTRKEQIRYRTLKGEYPYAAR